MSGLGGRAAVELRVDQWRIEVDSFTGPVGDRFHKRAPVHQGSRIRDDPLDVRPAQPNAVVPADFCIAISMFGDRGAQCLDYWQRGCDGQTGVCRHPARRFTKDALLRQHDHGGSGK